MCEIGAVQKEQRFATKIAFFRRLQKCKMRVSPQPIASEDWLLQRTVFLFRLTNRKERARVTDLMTRQVSLQRAEVAVDGS